MCRQRRNCELRTWAVLPCQIPGPKAASQPPGEAWPPQCLCTYQRQLSGGAPAAAARSACRPFSPASQPASKPASQPSSQPASHFATHAMHPKTPVGRHSNRSHGVCAFQFDIYGNTLPLLHICTATSRYKSEAPIDIFAYCTSNCYQHIKHIGSY